MTERAGEPPPPPPPSRALGECWSYPDVSVRCREVGVNYQGNQPPPPIAWLSPVDMAAVWGWGGRAGEGLSPGEGAASEAAPLAADRCLA